MTIDERLEELRERHEVLMQSVEALAEMLRASEQRTAQMMDTITRLVNIAAAYQERLDEHERRLDDLSQGR